MKTINLEQDEQMLLILHRHWFVLVRDAVLVAFLILIGLALFAMRGEFTAVLDPEFAQPFITFVFSVYTLFLLAITFGLWINYYLDVWVITTKRVIDIEQRSLFNREVSEFPIGNIQDITLENPNIISTLLDFGNMTIQTAGENNFLVRDVPHMQKAKEIIMAHCHKVQQTNGRAQ